MKRRPSVAAARSWLTDHDWRSPRGASTTFLANRLRTVERLALARAANAELFAEQARLEAQQARTLLVALHEETGVSL